MTPPYGDQIDYISISSSVAQGYGFLLGRIATASRPPLFSILLGYWLRIGQSPITFQAIFLLADIVITYLFLVWLTKRRVIGLIGATILYGLTFPWVFFVLQEPLLIFLTTLSIWMSLTLIENQTPQRAIFAGALWGLATLGKIVVLFAPFLLLFYIRKPLRKYLLGAFLGVLGIWVYRNWNVFDQLILVDDQLERMMIYIAQNGLVHTQTATASQALSAILAHPWKELGTMGINLLRFTMPYREHYAVMFGVWRKITYWWPMWVFLYMPLYIMAGIKAWRYQCLTTIKFMGLFYLIYWAQYVILFAEPRYSIPVFPILFALATLPV